MNECRTKAYVVGPGGEGATPNHQPEAAAGEVRESLSYLRDLLRYAAWKYTLGESRRVMAYADRVLEQTK
jgi:hypothetical protein